MVSLVIKISFDFKSLIKGLDFKTAKNGDNDLFKKFFHGLLSKGVYIAPSAYETWFITDALSYEDLDYTIKCIDEVSKEL